MRRLHRKRGVQHPSRLLLAVVCAATVGCSSNSSSGNHPELTCQRGVYYELSDGGPDGTLASCDCEYRSPSVARPTPAGVPPLQLASCSPALLASAGLCCASADYPDSGGCLCAEGATSCPITTCSGSPCGSSSFTVPVSSCLPFSPDAGAPLDGGSSSGCSLNESAFGQPCSTSAECGTEMTCFSSCPNCPSLCQVECHNSGDCAPLWAGHCQAAQCATCPQVCSNAPKRCR